MLIPDELNIPGWTCPLPLQNYASIVLGHGSGGKMMADLIQHLFCVAFDNEYLNQLGDSSILKFPEEFINNSRGKLAFTTDSFVVSPLFFPGGNIGELSVYGTVNDLAMVGAIPLFLSTGFILEEGLPMDTLGLIVNLMASACKSLKIPIVAGDTKVVDRGHGDGLYINTSGIGIVPEGVNISARNAIPGDAIIINGTIGDHGMAIMSVRNGLEFESTIKSDSKPLNGLVSKILDFSKEIHCMRDATRGGMAAVLNELAIGSKVGMEFSEEKVPVTPAVTAACEMLGMDPLYIANEGKMIVILPEELAEELVDVMRNQPEGKNATIIGEVVESHPGVVIAQTSIGGKRVVDLPSGELLPRIC